MKIDKHGLDKILGIHTLVLMPAYGRTYKSKEEVIKDLKGGKDFQIHNGPYWSIRDWEEEKLFVISGGITFQIDMKDHDEQYRTK